MSIIVSTNLKKSFGRGFDHVDQAKAQRDFITWWNSKSFRPVSEAPQPQDVFVPISMAA